MVMGEVFNPNMMGTSQHGSGEVFNPQHEGCGWALAMGAVRFRFGSVRFQGKETKLNRNRTVYLKQKPNQTVYELPVFKPNHLRKRWNQTI